MKHKKQLEGDITRLPIWKQKALIKLVEARENFKPLLAGEDRKKMVKILKTRGIMK